MKSESIGNYLKAIYQIQERQNDQPVSTTRLAAQLGVASASVTGMLKRLSAGEPKLVDYEPYYGATLTEAGRKSALELIRHHRLIESYLNQALGYPWDAVHAEAERLEHVISEEMEERLAAALGHPATDPHGDPIPDREGHFEKRDDPCLADLADGQRAEIRRVVAQEPELLRYLAGLGLTPSVQFELVSSAPFNGPVTLRVLGAQPSERVIGREIAEKILVAPLHSTITEPSHE